MLCGDGYIGIEYVGALLMGEMGFQYSTVYDKTVYSILRARNKVKIKSIQSMGIYRPVHSDANANADAKCDAN